MMMVLLSTMQSTFAQKANDILGIWNSEKKDAKIEIYSTNDGKIFGKLIWGARMYEKDGKTSRLAPNGKPFKDLVILQNFSFENGKWIDGAIYDPEEDKTYSCTMKLKEKALSIRGYVGISLLGRTTVWTR